ncbi:MAG TPA: family 16 glycoside hydrolase [Candidatus Acidoferrales bacterium]|nr:family 16 glycoside hydrolase [Candidatus Acidoferrales bacterium]
MLSFACKALVVALGLAAAAGKSAAATLKLAWQDTSDVESGFKIERLVGATYVEIATVGANAFSYTDSGLTAGARYCYRVRAFNAAGTSIPSNLSCATAAANAPDKTAGGAAVAARAAPLGSKWRNYRLALNMRSEGAGAMGVIFGYRDSENFFRFLWDAQTATRRLEKKAGGAIKVLAQDAAAYEPGKTYAVEIFAAESWLAVKIDGAPIFSLAGLSPAEGTVALYSQQNAGSAFDDILVEDLLSGSTLMAHDFDDGSLGGWTVIDETKNLGPSSWSAATGELRQQSAIGAAHPRALGTYALYTRGSWKDYRLSLKLRSIDDDFIGVMFRFQDSDNYYRLSWGRQSAGRELVKRVNGALTKLARDSVPYAVGQTYLLEIVARGSAIEVRIDGGVIFEVTDTAFDGGTVALYSCANEGASFDDVLVEDLASGATLLWDDFSAGDLAGWTILDEGDRSAPSRWSAASGALLQSSNIGSRAAAKLGTFALY